MEEGWKADQAAVHLNFCPSDKPDGFDEDDLDEVDKAMVKRTEAVNAHDMSYKDEHALKPATIGFVCDSSPVALLAWYVCSASDTTCPSILARSLTNPLPSES